MKCEYCGTQITASQLRLGDANKTFHHDCLLRKLEQEELKEEAEKAEKAEEAAIAAIEA